MSSIGSALHLTQTRTHIHRPIDSFVSYLPFPKEVYVFQKNSNKTKMETFKVLGEEVMSLLKKDSS